MGGQLATGHFLAGEQLDQLFLAAGGVFGGYHTHFDIAAFTGPLDRGNGLGLIVFDTDQGAAGVEQVLENMDAGNDLFGTLTHQTIIGGDVGLAFHRIDQQLFHALMVAQVYLDAGGETRAAHAGDARVADQVDQLGRAFFGVVGNTLMLNPLVFAIRVDDDAHRIHA